jgi:hypothetical protein
MLQKWEQAPKWGLEEVKKKYDQYIIVLDDEYYFLGCVKRVI